MRILVTGASGQLGRALAQTKPPLLAGKPYDLICLTRSQLDLADHEACSRIVEDYRPNWLVNAAAYTAVDQAENESKIAYAVNAASPGAFAKALAKTNGRMLHISTDFVFDGCSGKPYRPEDSVNPLNVYGCSKSLGENLILERLGSSAQACVLRTSWLYGPTRNNFLSTMLRLHKERDFIDVVSDQVGCPTSTLTLARTCWRLLECFSCNDALLPNILHWSDAGAATWYDFAVAIGEISERLSLLPCHARVRPIKTEDYKVLARRPSYSLLDSSLTLQLLDLEPIHWQDALLEVIQKCKD